ncbi:MAG TPA: hypothetical protein VF532_06890, partial [Candidatus Angelobacter sp.]
MATLSDKLPTILVLAVLVGIFVALRRHVKSSRLALWTTAWGLVFSHFIFQAFASADGGPPLLFIAHWGALQLAALFFIASLTSFFESRRLTSGLLALSGVPVLAYVCAISYECDLRIVYIACSAVIFFGPPLFVARFRKLTWEASLWMPVVAGVGLVSIFRAWHHQYVFGLLAVPTLGFGLPGFLYWRRYRRWSPG